MEESGKDLGAQKKKKKNISHRGGEFGKSIAGRHFHIPAFKRQAASKEVAHLSRSGKVFKGKPTRSQKKAHIVENISGGRAIQLRLGG